MFLYAFWTFFGVLVLLALFLSFKIAVADMRRRIIPDAYLFPLLIIGMITIANFPWICNIQDGITGMAFGYILAATVGLCFDRILTKRNPNAELPIGLGDIKLISVGGLWAGPTCLACALVFACIFGGIWARINKQKYIPFAPFFLSGEILSLIVFAFLV